MFPRRAAGVKHCLSVCLPPSWTGTVSSPGVISSSPPCSARPPALPTSPAPSVGRATSAGGVGAARAYLVAQSQRTMRARATQPGTSSRVLWRTSVGWMCTRAELTSSVWTSTRATIARVARERLTTPSWTSASPAVRVVCTARALLSTRVCASEGTTARPAPSGATVTGTARATRTVVARSVRTTRQALTVGTVYPGLCRTVETVSRVWKCVTARAARAR